MEKKITLTMQSNKDIDVVLNNHDGMTIGKGNRTVKADAIYDLLGYERGDTYTVESVNEHNVDAPVLQFFTELIKDITDRLNRLSEDQDDAQEEFDEEADNYIEIPTGFADEELPFT